MDLHSRFSTIQRTGRTSTFSFLPLTLIAAGFTFLALSYFGAQFIDLYKTWPWRNAVATKAWITNHEVQAADNPYKLPKPPSYVHTVVYAYQSGELEYSGEHSTQSISEETINWEGATLAPIPGSKFSVYYQPAVPSEHIRLVDPRIPFRRSLWRVGTGLAVCVSLMLMVSLIVIFYRPNARSKSQLPEKLDFT